MYKTKLQEVCQGNKWGLPKYSCIKDGSDHAPHFRASVSVNGVSFDSPSVSKSSKHALNEAAMLAFLHFASPDIQPVAEGAETEETHINSIIPSNESDVKVGKQHKYKMQLQNYAQSKTLDPPLYSSKSEGPPHALQFQATVTIDGHSFDSPGHFRTLKEAEHVAAKVALMSLSLDSFQEIDARLYKNLLQELAQSEGFTLPEYKTEKCGPPHRLTFFSTVEVEGEIFRGKGGKSHKLAEQNAAKVAYATFVERKSTRCCDPTSGGSDEEEMLKCSPSPDPSKEFVKQAEETNDEEVVSTENVLASTMESPILPKMEETIGSGKSPSSFESPPKSSTLAITDSKREKNVEVKSYLLGNKVRVYTCIPEITFPKGIVLLPIDDCKWVAVSLEFPNEKGK
ncbi:double-stranded RNA-binding protein 1-like [Rhododendron vialii]|uniref:double-stranded RNA-binding protein 1-like n=1 Tax=Rhododendron vialii TaxID=182163 RepID=UPI00265FB1C4|nr:double-stranded RNA-binding protein 1-like [Rhododendron vialii]